MKTVGGLLILSAGLSNSQKVKLHRMSKMGTVFRLASGVWIEAKDWHNLEPVHQQLIKTVAVVNSLPSASAIGRSARLVHQLPSEFINHTFNETHIGVPNSANDRKAVTVAQLVPAVLQEVGVYEMAFGSIKATSPLQTGLDLARFNSIEESVIVLDHGLRHRLFDQYEIGEQAAAMSSCKGIAEIRQAVKLVTPWSESPRESALKVKLWRAGLAAPFQQVDLLDEYGRFVGRADFYFPEVRLCVEYDGQGKLHGLYGVHPESAGKEEALRARRMTNAGHHLRRVDHRNYKDGTGIGSILAVYNELIGKVAPASPDLWRVTGGRAWRD